MENNFITSLGTCMPSTLSVLSGSLSLLYYSHIPIIIISFLFGMFVLMIGRDKLLSKIFFFLSFSFALWSILDLFTWLSSDSRVIMFAWSLTTLIEALVFLGSFYFVYVFAEKRDISFKYKILAAILVTPLIIIIPTKLNLLAFNYDDCYSLENIHATYYKYFIEIVSSLGIFSFLIIKIRKSDAFFKKQLILLAAGIFLFLLSFFVAVFLSSYLADMGYLRGYSFEMYGLVGVLVFLGMLGYMIVKFGAFNIKIIGVQALVVSLFILIASQFAFIQNPINRALTSITLMLVTIFGFNLINSVKKEIKQKEALAHANNEINERKNQLQRISDYLSVANSKLKELDNAKTEFVSIVAHQLQSPPTTIKGYSMLLSEGNYGELTLEQKDIIQKIFNANEQQVAFVDDLLSVSRLESGRVIFNFEKYQMGEICQEVIDNLFVKAKDKSLYLEFNKQMVPEVSVDRAKMREAVSNLVDNAIKYTKRGGVKLSLTICSLGGERCIRGNHLRIMVSDTGIGIPIDEMPRLFSKFSRGKDVKRLNANGTGLGLYVVKMITEGNRGKVWVESDGEGKGSRFIIELPI